MKIDRGVDGIKVVKIAIILNWKISVLAGFSDVIGTELLIIIYHY